MSLRKEFFILLHSGEGGREEGEATTTTTTTSARHEMNFDPVVTRGVVKYEITPVLRAPLPPLLDTVIHASKRLFDSASGGNEVIERHSRESNRAELRG